MAVSGKSRATIFDVAAKAGVAFKTVSRVLNNEAGVKDETRSRVLAAIRALNYSPNIAARGLAAQKSFLVGLFYDNPSPYYMISAQLGALEKCRSAGFHLVVELFPSGKKDATQKALAIIAETRLDGVILTPPVSDNAAIRDSLLKQKTPFTVISPPRTRRDIFFVDIDNRQAAYEMTCHLLSLGHRRVGFIKGHPTHGSAEMRTNGYLDALKQFQLTPQDGLVKQGYFSFETGLSAARELLELRPRPTAIFAANDDMAAGAIAAAHLAGLSVPQDLSVVGFDDTPVAAVTWPGLTTVRQPIVQMAAAAADLLLTQIKTLATTPVSRIFGHEVVIRGSTAAPRHR